MKTLRERSQKRKKLLAQTVKLFFLAIKSILLENLSNLNYLSIRTYYFLIFF